MVGTTKRGAWAGRLDQANGWRGRVIRIRDQGSLCAKKNNKVDMRAGVQRGRASCGCERKTKKTWERGERGYHRVQQVRGGNHAVLGSTVSDLH